MSNDKEVPPLGGSKLDRTGRLLEDPLPPKGRVKLAVSHYRIAQAEFEKTPQAIMKITSYLEGVEGVRKHHMYISRDGEIEVEDENGDIINGSEELKEVLDEWRVDFSRNQDNDLEGYTITINNTDKENVENIIKQAKESCSELFKGYQVRVDRGRYEKDRHSIYITVKQTARELPLPVPEAVHDRLEAKFIGHEITVRNTKKYRHRDVVNIMLSSPKGSDPERVHEAVRRTAKAFFADHGYRFVFALHTDTDNPHVHLSVKMFNERTGKKLEMNPKDLFALRQLYAEKAREQGINVGVSYNYERGKRKANRSMKEVKVAEKLREQGRDSDVNSARKATVKRDIKARKDSKIAQSMYQYRQQYKSVEEFQHEARRLKDQSFNTDNKAQKHHLIQLYKALEKEGERLAEDKVQQLNEQVRAGYRDDAEVLATLAAHADSDKTQQRFAHMAKTMERYAEAMPHAPTKSEEVQRQIDENLERQKQSAKDQAPSLDK